MGFKFNPLAFSGFDLVDQGGTSWASPVDTEGDLPAVGDQDGQARVVLDTDHIYLWDDTTSQWIDTGFLVSTFSAAGNAAGLSLSSNDKGNNVTEQLLVMHPATSTQPGGVSILAQNFAGNKTFDNDVTVTGDLTVSGTTTTINTTNLTVEDKNITINFGGNDASSEGAGLTVVRTVPATNGSFVYEDALASKFKLGVLAAESEIITAGHVQTITANKTMSGALTMSALTSQRPLKLTAGGVVTAGLIDLADNVNDVTGVVNIANGGTALATVPTNGQLLIGNGTDYTLATITPTANQTTVTNGVGTLTIGTVQDIAVTSSPEFAGLTLTAFAGVVKATAGVLSASLIIDADVDVPANNGGVGINAAKIADGTVSNTEYQYINSLTSNAQDQLDDKLDDFASTNDNRLVRTDGMLGEAVQESLVVLTDLGAMSGVTSLNINAHVPNWTTSPVLGVNGVVEIYSEEFVIYKQNTANSYWETYYDNGGSSYYDAAGYYGPTQIQQYLDMRQGPGVGTGYNMNTGTGTKNIRFFVGNGVSRGENTAEINAVTGISLLTATDAVADAAETLPITIATGNRQSALATGKTGDLSIATGNRGLGTGAANTGDITITTGVNNAADVLADSGNITLETGTSNNGSRGTINLNADNVIVEKLGATAALTIRPSPSAVQLSSEFAYQVFSGKNDGTNGLISFETGSAVNNTGAITLITGDSEQISSGAVSIYTGEANSDDDGQDTPSGIISIGTGFTYGAGVSGNIELITGDNDNSGPRGSITLDADADGSLLVNQPTGGVDLAVATTKYVDDYFSIGDVRETEVAFAESATNASIFSLHASVRSAKIYVSLFIDATSPLMEFYEITAVTNGTIWDYTVTSNGNSDVLLDVSAGAIRYTSSTYGGFVGASSKFKYRVISTTI